MCELCSHVRTTHTQSTCTHACSTDKSVIVWHNAQGRDMMMYPFYVKLRVITLKVWPTSLLFVSTRLAQVKERGGGGGLEQHFYLHAPRPRMRVCMYVRVGGRAGRWAGVCTRTCTKTHGGKRQRRGYCNQPPARRTQHNSMCVRACARAYVCVCVCVRACVRACVQGELYIGDSEGRIRRMSIEASDAARGLRNAEPHLWGNPESSHELGVCGCVRVCVCACVRGVYTNLKRKRMKCLEQGCSRC